MKKKIVEVLWWLTCFEDVVAFTTFRFSSGPKSTSSCLFGLKKYGKKQAALQDKLRKAKLQNGNIGKEEKKKFTDEEVKQRNDRKRFEELLDRGSASVLNEYSSDGYLSQAQEEEEARAARTLNPSVL